MEKNGLDIGVGEGEMSSYSIVENLKTLEIDLYQGGKEVVIFC